VKTTVIAAAALAFITSAANAEPVSLKFGYPAPVQTAAGQVVLAWNKDVVMASDGTLEIKMFPGATLANFNNVLDRIMNGVIEIGMGVFGEYTAQFPKTDAPSLPFECRNTTECSIALWRLYSNGVAADELAQVKPLALFNFPGASLQSTKSITRAEDLKGTKVVATGRTLAQATTLMGGAPVTLGPQDYYEALSRGTANVVIVSWPGAQTFKLQEIAKYHVDVPFGYFPSFIFMNKDAYGKLPQKARESIDRYAGEPFSRRLGEGGDKATEDVKERWKALPGHTVSTLAPQESERWKKILEPVTTDWVKRTPDGEKVLAAFRAELIKIRSGK